MNSKDQDSFADDRPYLAITCAWCGRMQRPNGEWIEVSPNVVRSLREPTDIVSVTHGVCPPCARSVFGAA